MPKSIHQSKRILTLYAKCSDLFNAEYLVDNDLKKSHEGNPLFIKGLCGGDDVQIQIDLSNNKIIGMQKVTHEFLMKHMNGDEQEEEISLAISSEPIFGMQPRDSSVDELLNTLGDGIDVRAPGTKEVWTEPKEQSFEDKMKR